MRTIESGVIGSIARRAVRSCGAALTALIAGCAAAPTTGLPKATSVQTLARVGALNRTYKPPDDGTVSPCAVSNRNGSEAWK